MAMKKVFLIFIAITFVSCSTLKKQDLGAVSSFSSVECSKYRSYIIKGNFLSETEKETQSAQISVNIASLDSIQLTVSAIFGIPVGYFSANKDYFSIYNILENSLYEGSPSEANIKRVINLELSYFDLLSIIKSTTAFSFKDYQEDPSVENLFRYSKNADFVDFAFFSNQFNLKQYQRKNRDGKIVFDVLFSDFVEHGACKMAKKIIIDFPQNKIKAWLNFHKIEEVNGFDKHFRLKVPNSINRINIDELD